MASNLPLGDELLALVLARLSASDLASAAAACRHWRSLCDDHSLWQHHAAAEPDASSEQQQKPAAAAKGACASEGVHGQRQDASTHQPPPPPPLPAKHRFLHAKWDHVWSHPQDHTRTVRAERGAHSGVVTSLSVLPGNALLATASSDHTLRLWRLPLVPGPGARALPRPQPLGSAQHPAPVLFVQLLSPWLALTATAAAIYVWRLDAASSGAGSSSQSGSSIPAGSSSSGGSAGSLQALQCRLLRKMSVDAGGGSSSGSRTAGCGARLLCAAAWDHYVAAGCSDGAVRVFDTFSGACTQLLRLHGLGVTALQAVQAAGLDLLVSGGGDGRVVVTDAGSALTLAEARLPRGGVSTVLLDPASGRLLGSSTAPGVGYGCWLTGRGLRDIPTPEARLQMAGNARLALAWAHPHPAQASPLLAAAQLAFGGGRHLLAADAVGRVLVLDLESGSTLLSMTPPATQQQPQGSHLTGAASRELVQPAAGPSTTTPPASTLPAAAGAAITGVRMPGVLRPPSGQVAPGGQLPRQLPGAPVQRCTCLSGSSMPVVAGFEDGTLCFWRWRRREPAQAAPQEAAAAAQHA